MNTRTVIHSFFTSKVSWFRWFLLLSLLIVNLPLQPVQAAPLDVIGPNEWFNIRLTDIKCNNADEDSWFSNGDEPYVLMAVITPDPFYGYVVDIVSTNVYNHVDKGDIREPNLVMMNKHVQQPAAIITQVMEEDSGGWSDVYTTFRNYANAAMDRERRNGVTDLVHIAQTIRFEVERGLHVISWGDLDEDDMIGSPSLMMVTYHDFDNLPVYGSFNRTQEFRANGVRYTLKFSVNRSR